MTNPIDLIISAIDARERAYAPYSSYCVGAALEVPDGRVFTGCNIENQGLTGTVCAESAAVINAVSSGVTNFSRMAVVGGYRGPVQAYCAPCGMCRQVLIEFADPDTFEIVLARTAVDFRIYRLRALLPLLEGPGLSPGVESFKRLLEL